MKKNKSKIILLLFVKLFQTQQMKQKQVLVLLLKPKDIKMAQLKYIPTMKKNKSKIILLLFVDYILHI